MKRSGNWIYYLLGLFVFILFLFSVLSIDEDNEEVSRSSEFSDFVENIRSGGPPKDGIPPIDSPKYVSFDEVDFLDEKDRVFVLETEDQVYIYPQSILVWHEIVNEEINGEKISVTYCPLTGSVVGYKGDIGKTETTYGTSGKLLNSNLVMYDRETDSLIPQILGVGINSELEGKVLETFPVFWSTWERVQNTYKTGQVLSESTGFFRNYNDDPYGSYTDEDSYYFSERVLFPVMNADERIHENKKVVIGVKSENSTLAIVKDIAKVERVINTQVGDVPIVTFYDKDLDTIRVFSREVGGEVLDFSYGNGLFIDNKQREWDIRGVSNELKLEYVTSFDVMWFSWVAYYSETEVYDGSS